MIEEIRIQNFKSYKDATLKLAPLTLLIGANASGKSNLIEAVRLLSWLAYGRRLDDIAQNVQQVDINIRGTLPDLMHDRSEGEAIVLGCTLSDLDEWRHFEIALQPVQPRALRIVRERLWGDHTAVPLYEIKEPAGEYSREVQVAFNNFARGGVKPTLPATDQQAVFTQLDIPSRFDVSSVRKARELIPTIVKTLQRYLQQIIFLDPVPQNMVDYSFVVDTTLKEDGENISAVLYDLCVQQQRKEEVLSFIRALPEQEIVDVEFLDTPRNEVMVRLVESFGGVETGRDAPLLSDGTLRILAVTAALLSAESGSLVVIEEIDNGIHPSRAEMILDNIQRVAREKELRVLLTSHNPALLDKLPLDAVPHVVGCYRDPHTGNSRLNRLEELVEYPELVARGSLGDLMTKGIIERYLKSTVTAEQKKQKALEWAASL